MSSCESSFHESDRLDRKNFVEQVLELAKSEVKVSAGATVIALNGNFGTGKTHILKMIDESCKYNESEFMPIFINAWESDYYGDPLIAMTLAFVEAFEKLNGKSDSGIEKVKRAGGLVFKAGRSVGKQIIESKIGVNIDRVVDSISDGMSPTSNEHIFEELQAIRKAFSTLKDEIRACIETSRKSVLFMVDELDRCRPDYAIEYLEVIKHVFDIQRTAFIIAVDKPHLENSAKHRFGSSLNFNEYFRKFVRHELKMPVPNRELYVRYFSYMIDPELDYESKRHGLVFEPSNEWMIRAITVAFQPTLRQIETISSVMRFLFALQEESIRNNSDRDIQFKRLRALHMLCLVSMRVVKPNLFELIESGLGSKEFIEEFLNVNDSTDHSRACLAFVQLLWAAESLREDNAIINDGLHQFKLIDENQSIVALSWSDDVRTTFDIMGRSRVASAFDEINYAIRYK